MPAKAGIQGSEGWIPAFAGMTDASSCDFVGQTVPAQVFSKETRKNNFRTFVSFVHCVVNLKVHNPRFTSRLAEISQTRSDPSRAQGGCR